jgi:hypothetical protein
MALAFQGSKDDLSNHPNNRLVGLIILNDLFSVLYTQKQNIDAIAGHGFFYFNIGGKI